MPADLFYSLLPEHLLLALLVLLMVFEIADVDNRIASLFFTLAAAAAGGVLIAQLNQGYISQVVPGEIVIDRFALLAKLVLLGGGLILGHCFASTIATRKFWMLLVSSLLGGMIIMDSAGFISLFIGIEMLSLPAFALMVHGCGASRATEGAFKYLLLSSVASALILFGLSLAYGTTGTLDIASFAAALKGGGTMILAASMLMLSGFFLKSAVFPFHGWAPDAYSSARVPVTAFLASVVKGAVVLGLVRIVSTTTLNPEITTAIALLSVLSIFYGNVTAIRQDSFKRLLAYSSIAHAGYMMFALVDNTGSREEALLYYVAVYAVTTITACACFSLLSTGEGDTLDSLDGAFTARPVPALVLALSLLSLAGIPPLPGFLAKFFIFKSVIASGHLVPALFAFAGSFLGVVYYLGIVFRLFKGAAESSAVVTASQRWTMRGVLLGSAVLVMFMLVPGIFHRLLA